MERYLGLLDKASLMKNEGLVQELIESKNVLIMPAAYFHLGRILEEKQDLKESARFYMKSYYLFPDSKYSKQSLRKTVDIYKKLGLKDEAAALEKKLKSLK
jgi:TolA-binding protein